MKNLIFQISTHCDSKYMYNKCVLHVPGIQKRIHETCNNCIEQNFSETHLRLVLPEQIPW